MRRGGSLSRSPQTLLVALWVGCGPSDPVPGGSTPPGAREVRRWHVGLDDRASEGWPASAPATGSEACTVSEGGAFSREIRIRDCHPSQVGAVSISTVWRVPATRIDLDLRRLADGSAVQWVRLEGVPAEAMLPDAVSALPVVGESFAWPRDWARWRAPEREVLASVVHAELPEFWDLGRSPGDARPGVLRVDRDPTRWDGGRATGALSFRDGDRWYFFAWEHQFLD